MNDVERDGLLLAMRVYAITSLMVLVKRNIIGFDKLKEAVEGSVGLLAEGIMNNDPLASDKIKEARKIIFTDLTRAEMNL